MSEEIEADDAVGEPSLEPVRFTVDATAAGERLDRWLGNQLRPAYSRSFLVGRIEAGAVRVNGLCVRPAHTLVEGAKVEFDPTPPPDRSLQPEAIAFDVLYEDPHLAVVKKPLGLAVHPGAGRSAGTLANGLLHRWPHIREVGAPERPGVVHRLDRDTSGLMVVALSNAARYKLVQQFKARTVKKEYHAIVVGKMALQSDYIDLPIGPDPKQFDRQRIDLVAGKPASTFYEVIERLPGYTYLRCSPLTGRTHQIRLHLGHLGHPCIADPIYGRQAVGQYYRMIAERKAEGLPVPNFNRQALHAARLRFEHPIDGRELDFECPLEEDMAKLLQFLRELR